MANLPIRSFLELNIAHITEKTADQMKSISEQDDPLWFIGSTPYGYFIYADENLQPEDVPADLYACIRLAVENEAFYILFDRDSDQVEELPVHEWT